MNFGKSLFILAKNCKPVKYLLTGGQTNCDLDNNGTLQKEKNDAQNNMNAYQKHYAKLKKAKYNQRH